MFEMNSNRFQYTALFCEENIWHLAQQFIKQGVNPSDLTTLFICNQKEQVVLFNQQVSRNNDPVIWDYHVILLRNKNNKYIIYDFDAINSFGINAKEYLELSFPSTINIHPDYHARFRLINAQVYINHFT